MIKIMNEISLVNDTTYSKKNKINKNLILNLILIFQNYHLKLAETYILY